MLNHHPHAAKSIGGKYNCAMQLLAMSAAQMLAPAPRIGEGPNARTVVLQISDSSLEDTLLQYKVYDLCLPLVQLEATTFGMLQLPSAGKYKYIFHLQALFDGITLLQ